MSIKLEKEASSQSSMLFNIRRQLFQSVPPLPPDIDLAEKTALVTGSNVGLGLECARHFLKLQLNRLIMGVRSLEKGEAAAAELRSEFPEARIDVWQLDMESFRSVQAFAARCEQELDRLNVAVLNAALGKLKFERAKESGQREITLQVNYLSTALLATLLIPKMKPTTSSSSEPGRLTIITSDAALGVKLDDPSEGKLLDSLDRAANFDGFQQYSKSKLLITMFSERLSRIIDPDEVVINCCNPGAVKGTAFFREMDSWLQKFVIGLLFNILGRKAVDGAKIYVHSCLVLGKESHGSFTDWLIRAWPVTMYSSFGRQISDKLWIETIEELRSTGIEDILNGKKH